MRLNLADSYTAVSGPEISVIIPTYNRAHLVGRSIQSVIAQTYEDWELIVVDDASTDNTKGVVTSFGDPRIRYVRYEENRGGGAARNAGIELARGEYVAFLDSDDEWLPEKLEMQMVIFDEAVSSVGGVYSGFVYVRSDGSSFAPTWELAPPVGEFRETLLRHNFIDTSTSILRRECLLQVGGFDERLPRYQDWDLWLRIAQVCEFRCVKSPLVRSYITSGSISSSESARARAMRLILKKHRTAMQTKPRIFAEHLFRLGRLLIDKGDFDEGRRCLLQAVRLHPTSARYLGLLIVTLLGERVCTMMLAARRSHA